MTTFKYYDKKLKLTVLEEQIYSACFVRTFQQLHARGVDNAHRAKYSDTSERVRMWELDCARTAHEDAVATISLRRTAMRIKR